VYGFAELGALRAVGTCLLESRQHLLMRRILLEAAPTAAAVNVRASFSKDQIKEQNFCGKRHG
jgi:hypothetical protein